MNDRDLIGCTFKRNNATGKPEYVIRRQCAGGVLVEEITEDRDGFTEGSKKFFTWAMMCDAYSWGLAPLSMGGVSQ